MADKQMGLGEWAARATSLGGPATGAGATGGGAGPSTTGAPGSAAGGAPGAPGMAGAAGTPTPEEMDAWWKALLASKPEYAQALMALATAVEALKPFNPEFDPGVGQYIAEEVATGKYPQEQAIAIGMSRAREAGLKAPEA